MRDLIRNEEQLPRYVRKLSAGTNTAYSACAGGCNTSAAIVEAWAKQLWKLGCGRGSSGVFVV